MDILPLSETMRIMPGVVLREGDVVKRGPAIKIVDYGIVKSNVDQGALEKVLKNVSGIVKSSEFGSKIVLPEIQRN